MWQYMMLEILEKSLVLKLVLCASRDDANKNKNKYTIGIGIQKETLSTLKFTAV